MKAWLVLIAALVACAPYETQPTLVQNVNYTTNVFTNGVGPVVVVDAAPPRSEARAVWLDCEAYLARSARCVASLAPAKSYARAHAAAAFDDARHLYERTRITGTNAEIDELEATCHAALRAYDASCGG